MGVTSEVVGVDFSGVVGVDFTSEVVGVDFDVGLMPEPPAAGQFCEEGSYLRLVDFGITQF